MALCSRCSSLCDAAGSVIAIKIAAIIVSRFCICSPLSDYRPSVAETVRTAEEMPSLTPPEPGRKPVPQLGKGVPRCERPRPLGDLFAD